MKNENKCKIHKWNFETVSCGYCLLEKLFGDVKMQDQVTGTFYLVKNKNIVGEAVVMSLTNVVFHLYSDIRNTQNTTYEQITKKYKLERVIGNSFLKGKQ
jgi:hypothetical protein